MTKKVDVLIGMQFGSEGKGLIAGHLGMSGNYDTVVNVNMPNAGHTYVTDGGEEYMFKVLPNGAISPYVKRVMLGPDSVFAMDRLLHECQMVGPTIWEKLRIHENATILRHEHYLAEQDTNFMGRIGSTAQGSSMAMAQKIWRNEDAVIGFDPDMFHENVYSHEMWMRELEDSHEILLEGCQGYSLGLNAGFYPYCTSRDCTPGRLAAGAGIPHHWIRHVIGAARLHPIRVGGNSGPCYSDQRELTWEEVGQKPELTTVTQRERRIFTWSDMQIKNCIRDCGVDHVFLNFCNYDPDAVAEAKTSVVFAGAKVKWTGWGPAEGDVSREI